MKTAPLLCYREVEANGYYDSLADTNEAMSYIDNYWTDNWPYLILIAIMLGCLIWATIVLRKKIRGI